MERSSRRAAPALDACRVLDLLPDAVIAANASHEIVYANAAVETLLGWSPADLAGKPVTALAAARFREAQLAAFSGHPGAGVPRAVGRTIRIAALHREGHEIEVDLALSIKTGDDGALVVASLHPTAERVRLEELVAEKALRDSEDRLRLACSTAGLGVFEWHVTTDEAVWENDRAFEIFGRTREDGPLSKAEYVEKVLHEDDREGFESALREAMKPGRRFEAACRIWRKDGELRWIQYMARFDFSGDGRPQRLVGVVKDITEERRTDAALHESDVRFQTLADNIPQLAWMADETGWIFWYNKRWYDYTGTTLETMQGWGWKTVHHPEHIERVTNKWRGALAEGRGWEDTFPLRGSDGTYRWFLSRAFPIHDEHGDVVRWFGTNTDVTEERNTQEALAQAVRARDVFLGIASHELKTPLTPLMLQLHGIERMIAKEDGAVQLARILQKVARAEKQGAHLVRLVNSLLDVSRLSENRLKLDLEPLDLSTVVSEVVDRVRSTIDGASCDLTLSLEANATGTWDRLRVEQVIANLIDNAVKYGAGKPIEIEVATDGADAVLVVRDHGIGISPEDQKRIFGRFERAVSDRNYGGFGLGLWIARQVIEAMGGAIGVQSKPGEGAAFEVRLPRAPVPRTS